MPSERDLLTLLRAIRHRLDANVSLDALATRAGWSPFHLHRAFRRMVGETPKQYTLRLRLEGAAARLLASDDSIVDVALAAGFSSHEVFTRAFRRHFGRTPAAYRSTALAGASPRGARAPSRADRHHRPMRRPVSHFLEPPTSGTGDPRCPLCRSNDATLPPSQC